MNINLATAVAKLAMVSGAVVLILLFGLFGFAFLVLATLCCSVAITIYRVRRFRFFNEMVTTVQEWEGGRDE